MNIRIMKKDGNWETIGAYEIIIDDQEIGMRITTTDDYIHGFVMTSFRCDDWLDGQRCPICRVRGSINKAGSCDACDATISMVKNGSKKGKCP